MSCYVCFTETIKEQRKKVMKFTKNIIDNDIYALSIELLM